MVKAQVDPEFERDPLRILVVDDEVLVRHVIAEELRDLGLVVVEAANADEAWSYLASGGPADLVFTDVRMPGSLSGAQLARRIRRDRPSLPVVVTSGGFDLSEWRESVLLKPYAPMKPHLILPSWRGLRENSGPQMTASHPTTILLIEDDIAVRHPLAEYLRECGFTVLEAASGEEALVLMSEGGRTVDVVFADMTMAGGGFPLLQRLRTEHPSVQIIAVGSVESAADGAGKLCNDGPALTKPYEHHLVLERIRQSLGHREKDVQAGDEHSGQD